MSAAPFVANLVGQPIERSEDLRLLRGRGRFADDVHEPGMLHAAIVRSPVAHGRIRAVDAGAARQMAGVHAVFMADDIAAVCGGSIPTIPLRVPRPETSGFEQPVIAHGKVRYVGEPLAIVVAASRAIAEDAVNAVDVDIDALPAIADWHRAAEGEALLFEAQRTNRPIIYTAKKGDARRVKAPYVRRERFSVHRHSAVCLEPKGLLAIWKGESTTMTLVGAAKVPFITRRLLAKHMDLPEECVEAIEVDVGGGFGVRGDFQPEDFLIPFAARRLNRPVKWTEDRLENLLASNHAREVECELELRCELDGTILALTGRTFVDAGAYFRNAAPVPAQNVAQFMSGPYRIPNIDIESSVFLTNKSPVGVYRGPGRFEGDFFRERLLDMAARDLKIDRLEFRRRNLPRPSEMPYPLATIYPPGKAEELDSGDYEAALDRCLTEFKWREKAGLQGRLVDGRYHGLGVGCFVEGGGAGPRENARITLDADGAVSVYVGSANVGQGLETVTVQIAADALSMPMERIRFYHGSTTYLKEGFGSFHSRSVVMGGCAVLDAAEKLKTKIRSAAAALLECRDNEVIIGPCLAATHGGRSVSPAELGALGLEAEGTFANNGKHTYAYGAAAAHVAVDPGTGRVELLEYVTVEDVGRVINPLTARGQAIGAVVQGLGGCFLEHLQYDDEGQFLTASLADYLLPTATDFPNIKAIVTGDVPCPHNPLGAKGGGEGGIVPVAGVVANAVADALQSLGAEPRTLPLSAPKVWELIQASLAVKLRDHRKP